MPVLRNLCAPSDHLLELRPGCLGDVPDPHEAWVDFHVLAVRGWFFSAFSLLGMGCTFAPCLLSRAGLGGQTSAEEGRNNFWTSWEGQSTIEAIALLNCFGDSFIDPLSIGSFNFGIFYP